MSTQEKILVFDFTIADTIVFSELNFIYFFFLFLAVLGLHCCPSFYSSCRERRLFSSCGAPASHCSGFSCGRAQTPGCIGFSSQDTWA